MLRLLVRVAVLFGLAACAANSAAGEDSTVLNRCWTPAMLAGTPAELKPMRARIQMNLAPLKEEQLPTPTPLPAELRGSLRSVELPAGVKLIALTFDLCETDSDVAGYDWRIVDLLRAQDVKATFFAGGKWVETHQERAQQLLADPRFEIGGHNWRHLDPLRITSAVLGEEMSLTEAALARAKRELEAKQCFANPDGSTHSIAPLKLLRFPYGLCNAKTLTQAADTGLISVQWDVVTGDPDPRRSAKAIAATIIDKAHPGAIVVAHANGRGAHTAEAFAIAIPKLKEQGYGFVTVSELIAAGKPVLAPNCRGIGVGRPGQLARRTDQDNRYDFKSILRRLH